MDSPKDIREAHLLAHETAFQLVNSQVNQGSVTELEDLGDGFWLASTAPAEGFASPGDYATHLVTNDGRAIFLPEGMGDSARRRLKDLYVELGESVEVGWLLQEAMQAGTSSES